MQAVRCAPSIMQHGVSLFRHVSRDDADARRPIQIMTFAKFLRVHKDACEIGGDLLLEAHQPMRTSANVPACSFAAITVPAGTVFAPDVPVTAFCVLSQ